MPFSIMSALIYLSIEVLGSLKIGSRAGPYHFGIPCRVMGAESQVLSATMSRYATSLKKSYCSAKLFLGVNTRKTHKLVSCPLVRTQHLVSHISPQFSALLRHRNDTKRRQTRENIKTYQTIHNMLSAENCRFSSSSTSNL